MAYIKITDGNQVRYSLGQLRKDNKTVSFPKVIAEETLASYGVYSFVFADAPSYNVSTEVITLSETATQVGGKWTYVWTVRDKTSAELAADAAYTATSARNVRDGLLAETDYLALSDATLSSAMATYRQALRDITGHSDWPNLVAGDWPTKP